jgi:peptide-methionine (S)-S-oxide reductase
MRPIHLATTLLTLAILGLPLAAALAQTKTAEAIFAGGCFWCMEPPFDATEGVISTTSGYSGGDKPNPTYHDVSSGTSGHYEVVRVEYDPAKVGYKKLLDVFWHNIDPFNSAGQFCDKGPQYRAVIFYGSDEEKRLAEASKAELEASKRFHEPIVTQILPAKAFYPADYHQDFYLKNPLKYKFYRFNCRRDARLDEVWGAEREQAGH